MTERIVHSTGVFMPNLGDEARYEKHIAYLSSHIFPDYYWCDFKAEVRHPDGLVHADAALVAKDYSKWYVLEVELSQHRWDEHIRPQLSKLSNGIYSDKNRRQLISRQPSLSDAGMKRLDIYYPEIALIIEMASPEIRAWCRLQHILCIEASPYKSRTNDILLAINGDQPDTISTPRIRRVIGRARKTSLSPDVPMLLYEFTSEVSEREDEFRVLLGGTCVSARNFGSDERGIALKCTLHDFENALGLISQVDLVKVDSSTYRMEPKSSQMA
jgi:hypothetical protein